MSCDFGVWYPSKKLSYEEAGELYCRLCDYNLEGVKSNPAIESFYQELTKKHPEIDDIPEEEIDNHDLCPWSVALDRSPGQVIMCCVWSKAEYVYDLVLGLAQKHGLAVYDPQSSRIVYPDGRVSEPAKKPWWKFW